MTKRPLDAAADGDYGGGDVRGVPQEKGVGELKRYSIDWSMMTFGEDPHIGGEDFKRLQVRGKLMFKNEEGCDDDDEEVEVGSISLTQYRMDYIRNNGISLFEVFDETQEGCDVYEAIVQEGMEDYDDEFSGDIQLIDRIQVKPAHRGHGLALFMIDAADAVINGHESLCIFKPFPLQFEKLSSYYGYALPPPSSTEAERQAAQDAALDKLKAYYARLGFKEQGDYMLRWSGFKRPSLEQAMQK